MHQTAAGALLPRITKEFLHLRRSPASPLASAAILELMPAGIYVCDEAGRITFFNRRAAELWGRKPRLGDEAEKFCACHRVYDLHGTFVPPEATPMAAAVCEGRSFRDFEAVVERPDGSRFDASVTIDPLRDETGRIIGAINVFEDITPRKAAQRRLAFLASLNEALATKSESGALLEPVARLLGEHLRAEQCFVLAGAANDQAALSVRHWRRAAAGADAPLSEGTLASVTPELWRVGARDEPLSIVSDVVAKASLRRHLGVYAALDVRSFVAGAESSGQTRLVLAVASSAKCSWTTETAELVREVAARVAPVVEQARAEMEIRRRDRDFRSLADASPIMMWVTDAGGRCTYVNLRWREFTGRAEETAQGSGWLEVVHPEDKARAEEAFRRASQAGHGFRLEYRLRRHDGTYRWVLDTGEPRIVDGVFTGYVGAVIDITERWRMEQALRESEARLRLAARSGKLGIWDWDIVANAVTWSDSLFEIHGVRRECFEATVEGFAALVHPDDRKPVQRAMQSSLEHDVPYELEFRCVKPGGAVVWVFTNAIVLREDGRAVRMLGATFDITARKQAELALRESELRFRTLASHAPVGIFLTDTQGDALYVNDTWRAIAGMTLEQARGKGWRHALHPDDRERVTREWYDAVRERRAFSSAHRFLRPDGTVTWLQGSAIEFRNANGVLTGYLGTVVDITQRKSAEEALRESEQRFRTLASHAPVGIFLTDPQGETIFVNESWCAMSGLTREAAMGLGWAKAMHADDRPRVAAEWFRAIAENRASAAEFRFVRADGRDTWVQGNAVQLRDDAGRLIGYIGTVADLTERKAAQVRLQSYADDLEQRVAERTASLREAIAQMEEFSYSVSHDLRAPLRAMNAYAQALTEDYSGQLDEVARTYIEKIRRSSVRMEKLTHDMLDYSRIARAEMSLEELNLEQLIRDVVLQYRELQPPQAEIEVAAPLLAVRAHESSLGQCFANLLTNAAKFVAPGTKPRIRIHTEAAGERVRVWICDNGIGIAPQYQERLFRVFERVPTRPSYEGTGIGLAIVRKATEKMGGTCGVRSDGANGCQFWMELLKT